MTEPHRVDPCLHLSRELGSAWASTQPPLRHKHVTKLMSSIEIKKKIASCGHSIQSKGKVL